MYWVYYLEPRLPVPLSLGRFFIRYSFPKDSWESESVIQRS